MALVPMVRSLATPVSYFPLTQRIRRQLSGSGWGTSELQIEDDGQAVTLRGVASSFYQRQLWLHRTKQVIGEGRYINDQILVDDRLTSAVFD